MSTVEDTDVLAKALEEVRALVVERLRARRLEIEEVIFARVRDGVSDPAGSGDIEYMEGLRETVAAVVGFGLTGIGQAEDSMEPVPAVVVAQARRAARVGVGLDTVMRRYVAGHALLEDFVMQEADHSDLAGRRTALRRVLKSSSSLLDRLIISITSAYMQELERTGNSPVGSMRVLAPDRRQHGSQRMRTVADGGGATSSHDQVAQVQRVRILGALAEVVADRGFAGTTVGLVVTRARVSRRTFYELFGCLEDGLVAVMDVALQRLTVLAVHALEEAESWRDGIRSALAVVLAFFDSEPELARVCIVETLAGGPVVLAHRERLIEAFRLPVAERIDREVSHVSPLTTEWVMSSVLGIMHAHIVAGKPGPLIELLGPLMGLATAPYLGARSVEQEIEQGDELARTILTGDSRWGPSGRALEQGVEQGAALPAILGNPSARRARECLLFLGEHQDSSNREVAAGIDIAHQSQISKLLGYLAQENLVVKRSEGAGKRNAWRLTLRGEEVAKMLLEWRD